MSEPTAAELIGYIQQIIERNNHDAGFLQELLTVTASLERVWHEQGRAAQRDT